MDIVIMISVILLVFGIIGSLVPGLPGPILSFAALVLAYFTRDGLLELSTLIIFAFGVVILTIMDYLAPIIGAKFFGATKKGLTGALVGGLAGLVLLPPLGLFAGALVGAIIGEIAAGKKNEEALKAGLGVLFGGLSMIVLQTIYSLAALGYFLIKVI